MSSYSYPRAEIDFIRKILNNESVDVGTTDFAVTISEVSINYYILKENINEMGLAPMYLTFNNLLKITDELSYYINLHNKRARIYENYIINHLSNYYYKSGEWVLDTAEKFQRYCRVIVNIDKLSLNEIDFFKEDTYNELMGFFQYLIFLVLRNCDHENPDFKLIKRTIFSICAMKIEHDTKVEGMTINSSIESLQLPFVIKGRERERVQNYETLLYQALENLQAGFDSIERYYKFKSVDILVDHVNLDNEIVNNLKYFLEMYEQGTNLKTFLDDMYDTKIEKIEKKADLDTIIHGMKTMDFEEKTLKSGRDLKTILDELSKMNIKEQGPQVTRGLKFKRDDRDDVDIFRETPEIRQKESVRRRVRISEQRPPFSLSSSSSSSSSSSLESFFAYFC
jgi:hypothetical protein